MAKPTLHMFCGKIASGKSTLAARLAEAPATVLIAEDAWLDGLYRSEMSSLADYLRCTGRLRGVIGPHVTQLLDAGVSVVLDFSANTLAMRAWMRQVLSVTDAVHQLHLLDPPDAVCLSRLRARNAAGTHPFAVTEAQYWDVARHFAPPSPDEGFAVIRHGCDGAGSP